MKPQPTPMPGRWRAAAALAAAMATFAPSTSHACGACIEDKVAATYDHAVVQSAAASGNVMVFCEVTGALDMSRLKEAARRVRGVKPQSVRVSAQPPALSFAVDPRRLSPQAAVDMTQRGLLPHTRLTIVRLLTTEAPAGR